MPRSSGGGSHRSGGSSSHHSGGGSHRSGGSSNYSSHRSSNSYFEGSEKYVYYRHRKPVFFYANYNPAKKPGLIGYLVLLIYVPFFLALIMMIVNVIQFPVKVSTDYDTQIVIKDGADVIEDEARLEKSLQAFYEKTGITPAVMTVNNEDWFGYYDNMEAYAYDLYVNSFVDERHWLIVYSQPEKPDPKFNDWFWEGMQGNDTVRILSLSVCDSFNDKLQHYLTAGNFYSVGDAVGKAFDELTPTVMKIQINWELLGAAVMMGAFLTVHCWIMTSAFIGNPYKRKAVPCPEGAREDVCDYCGGIYVIGTCIKCPHCGAPLKVHNSDASETDDSGYGSSSSVVELNGEKVRL